MTSYFETNFDHTSLKEMHCLLLLHKSISVIVNENVIQNINCITYLLAFILDRNFVHLCYQRRMFLKLNLKLKLTGSLDQVRRHFLGHLSHSGGLLLWVSVRCQAPCVNIFFQRPTWPILTKFGTQNLQDKEIRNCKFHYPHPQGEVIWGKTCKTCISYKLFSTPGRGSDKLSA